VVSGKPSLKFWHEFAEAIIMTMMSLDFMINLFPFSNS